MYSKQQASQLRQEFWTAFGKYMQPIRSSEGEKVNWVNYKTGAKNIYFRMHAAKGATISIELTDASPGARSVHFEKLLQLRSLFREAAGEEWIWQPHFTDEHGRNISRVYAELEGVSIFNRSDWPALISFFKPRIIAIDVFWNQVKHEFDVW